MTNGSVRNPRSTWMPFLPGLAFGAGSAQGVVQWAHVGAQGHRGVDKLDTGHGATDAKSRRELGLVNGPVCRDGELQPGEAHRTP